MGDDYVLGEWKREIAQSRQMKVLRSPPLTQAHVRAPIERLLHKVVRLIFSVSFFPEFLNPNLNVEPCPLSMPSTAGRHILSFLSIGLRLGLGQDDMKATRIIHGRLNTMATLKA